MSDVQIQQPDFGTGSKTLNIYVTGFIICIMLTLLPFAAVMVPGFFKAMTVGIIVASAMAQFLIQLVCFLRLNYHTEQARVNVQSLAFVLFVVFVIIIGSLWIMDSMNHRMMVM